VIVPGALVTKVEDVVMTGGATTALLSGAMAPMGDASVLVLGFAGPIPSTLAGSK
jgi:hypothetical protein